MATVRPLRNAPITEALIDIQAKLSVTPVDLQRLVHRIATDYPVAAARPQFTFVLGIGINPPPTPPLQASGGFICQSPDGRNVVQLRPDGLSCHRLAPYTGWDDLYARALQLWATYADMFGAIAIRISVRNINQIRIPNEVRLEEYLPHHPGAALERHSYLTSFYSRVTTRNPNTKVDAAIVQSSQPTPDSSVSIVTLDVDVKRDDITLADLEESLRVLHDAKNAIFFDSVTDLALERYE
jgi:uncharacterized protein (TIGR04255 family)